MATDWGYCMAAGKKHANITPVSCLFSPRIMIYSHVQMGLLGPEIHANAVERHPQKLPYKAIGCKWTAHQKWQMWCWSGW